ncbi:MAG: hypothetical protein N2313_04485 [Meiothermus ruber]|uniref:hypothetical protein n=1 Tax=Meiothermus sp. TaxID=1955249 RepID=UPI00298F05A8|nr:hypothetical protein [Meiothermus sp.]MCX7802261.1 hypothetical protein [Meiothermus ruber]
MHEFIERLHRALECYRALRERSTVVRAYGGRVELDAHYAELQRQYEQALLALEEVRHSQTVQHL